MLESTVKRLETLSKQHSGYITTAELLQGKVKNRQIGAFVQSGRLEKISHGHYWFVDAGCEKPDDYKAIEVCITNPGAIICADSACFYLGLIDVEPECLSVATRRSDRSKMKVNFPICRHYFGDSYFEDNSKKVTTPLGSYRVYDLDRSVCDCIRFKDNIDKDIFNLIIENYRKSGERQMEQMLEYAGKVRMLRRVKRYLE